MNAKKFMMTAGSIFSMRTTIAMTLVVIVFGLTGCSTIIRGDLRKNSGYKEWYYPATQEGFRMLFVPPYNEYMGYGCIIMPAVVVNLAFSIPLETLFIPIDYFDGNYWRPYLRPECPPERKREKDLTLEDRQELRDARLRKK